MLFVNVQKPDALFRKIGECEGNVSYLDGQGARRDLKGVAAQLLTFDAPLRPQRIPALEVLADSPKGQRETDEFYGGNRLLKNVPPPRSSAVAAVFHARR